MDISDLPSAVLGSASVPLRPLRFLFDVEADAAVVPSATASSQSFEAGITSVHVRVRLSARAPPLLERQDDHGGFLRSEVPQDAYAVDTETPVERDEGGAAEEEALAALRGSFVWLLVRVQPAASRGLQDLRVQYQPFSSCESFCLPVDHTNILRVLVTDDVVRPAKEVTYDDEREEKAVARALAIVEREQAQRTQQVAALKDAERAAELAAERAAFAAERARLEQELANVKVKSEELERERVERRGKESDESREAEARREDSQRQAAATADEALELLKGRLASDAKEREELQRRLHALQEEKLALMHKSCACAVQ